MFEFENEKIITSDESLFLAILEGVCIGACIAGAIFVLRLIKITFF
jgi:hypothetical protein